MYVHVATSYATLTDYICKIIIYAPLENVIAS